MHGVLLKIESTFAPMRISRIFLICCHLLLLNACSARLIDPQEEEASALLHVRILTRTYGELNTPFYRDYLDYLEKRLSFAAAAGDKQMLVPYRFVLLNSPEPFAFSPGGGYVLISKGLILSLRSEAELAFVLSHELSHQRLGHTANYNPELDYHELVPNLNRANWQKEAESEADLSALGIMAFAGYDPNAAVGALLNAYKVGGEKGENETHPKLDSRIYAVRQAIEDSAWKPPGTLDRRAFQKLRRTLLHA